MHLGRDIFFAYLCWLRYGTFICYILLMWYLCMFAYLLSPDLLVLLSLILYCLFLVLRHKMFSQKPSHIKCFHNIPLLQNVFTKSCFVGILESASLRTGMSIEIRLHTSRSPHTPRKRNLH